MTTALLVIDMQTGLFADRTPRYEADAVIERINALSQAIRSYDDDSVVFIQHDSTPGDGLEPGTAQWEILPQLVRRPQDTVIRKTACDAFYKTDLAAYLSAIEARRLIITGCATDFCVDTTLRSAASKDFELIVASDAHTTTDRPHLDARSIIQHHNWMWQNLIVPDRPVTVAPTDQILLSVLTS